MATTPSAGVAHGWWLDGVLIVLDVSCRWISSVLQTLARRTWWLVVLAVGLGAFVRAIRGDIGPVETLVDSLILMAAMTKVHVLVLAYVVLVPSLHPDPMPG
ncbi:hypothetical protein D1007_47184 [Hordeum vulgare]|nr:hypothetical protein D1007_47184 [Hordeum vulgare]